jgi:hypothetical protein
VTFNQSKQFILEELKFRAPALFSEEALSWINGHGYQHGELIEYHGQVYKILKRCVPEQIVITRKTKRLKVPCTCMVCASDGINKPRCFPED